MSNQRKNESYNNQKSLYKNVTLPTVQQYLWGCSGRYFKVASVLEAMHDYNRVTAAVELRDETSLFS